MAGRPGHHHRGLGAERISRADAPEGFTDRYLYVSRNVDGDILNLLDETQETVVFYNQQESERGAILFDFALIYLGFAVILMLAAIWVGLWFAERSRPIGRLAGCRTASGGRSERASRRTGR